MALYLLLLATMMVLARGSVADSGLVAGASAGAGSDNGAAGGTETAAGGPGATVADIPDLTGHWVLDREHSDQLEARINALKNIKRREDRRREDRATTGPQSRHEAFKKRRRAPALWELELVGMLEKFREKVLVPEKLVIEHQDPRLVLKPQNGEPRTLFTDGRSGRISARGGMRQTVVYSAWEGQTLVVETTFGPNARVIEKFQLQDGQLLLDLNYISPGIGKPLQLHLIYN